MATQVDQIQNRSTNGGYKYATLEEAVEANKTKAKEYYENVRKINKEQYNAYQRERYRKRKEEQQKQQESLQQLTTQQQSQLLQQQSYLQQLIEQQQSELQNIQQEYQKQVKLLNLGLLIRKYLLDTTISAYQQFKLSLQILPEDFKVIDTQIVQFSINSCLYDKSYYLTIMTKLCVMRSIIDYVQKHYSFPSTPSFGINFL